MNWKQKAEKIEKDYKEAAVKNAGVGVAGAGVGVGVALITSGIFFWKTKSDKKHREDVFTLISERDVKSYDVAIVELNERITRIVDESVKLKRALEKIKTFGIDYNKMSEAQQYELGSYVNLVSSSTQLLINPIKGLQPKYSDEDYNDYIS